MDSELTAKLYVSVVVRDGDSALVLVEKDDDGTMKNNLPGGGMELGETPLAAAKRECREETGLIVRPHALLQVTANAWSKKHSVLFYFEAAGSRDAELKLEEGVSARWMTHEEIADLPDDAFVFGVKAALVASFTGQTLPKPALLMRQRGDLVEW